jgi:hypothetical protein
LEGWFIGTASFHSRNSIALMQYLLAPAFAADGAAAADGARPDMGVVAKVRLMCDSNIPRRIAVCSDYLAAQVADVDLAKLRKLSLSITDVDGHPAPGVTVGVMIVSEGSGGRWQDRFVTDGDGHAELSVDDKADWLVYAATGRASAARVIAKADPAGPLSFALQALATMRLHIVDGEGHPVRGARAQFAGGSVGGRRATEVLDKCLDNVAGMTNGASLALLHSNAAGDLELRFLDRPTVTSRFKVVAGARSSAIMVLQSAEGVQEVVVK